MPPIPHYQYVIPVPPGRVSPIPSHDAARVGGLLRLPVHLQQDMSGGNYLSHRVSGVAVINGMCLRTSISVTTATGMIILESTADN